MISKGHCWFITGSNTANVTVDGFEVWKIHGVWPRIFTALQNCGTFIEEPGLDPSSFWGMQRSGKSCGGKADLPICKTLLKTKDNTQLPYKSKSFPKMGR